MTPEEADGNTISTDISLNCEHNEDFDIEIIGSKPVSGRPKNFTQCGINQGVCEVTYAIDNNDDVGLLSLVENRKNLNIKIKSTFHTNPDIAAGAFNGSAILKLNIK